jgi:hypothetical protein
MAWIAKQGVPVIVDQISKAYCDAFFDWGGMHQDWWYASATNNRDGWNAIPNSVIIEEDTIF